MMRNRRPDMLDQNTFTETIRAVQDIIRTSAEPMTREEILSYFKDMDLNAQQEEMVLEFLSTPHDDPQPEENEPETKEAEYEETAEKEQNQCHNAGRMEKSSRIDACTYRVYQQHRSTTAGGSIGKTGNIH